MAFEVDVYFLGQHRRSAIICNAMAEGIRAVGDKPTIRQDTEYREPSAPIAVFYGFIGNLPKIMADYRAAGLHAVYIDLGYWSRHKTNRWDGYHKISVNGRHPTPYFMNRRHDAARASSLGIKIRPWSSGSHILIAGMSGRSAETEGFQPEEWECAAIDDLRRYTSRPIVYRPKPSWKEAKPIQGVGYSARLKPIDSVLNNCHAVVTHHSNVAVDGLIGGVPAFCWHGVAASKSLQDLSKIEAPYRPEGREDWAAAIAWTQFDPIEMRAGVPWRHFKNEGILP
jgi:hypothetical protein